MQNRLLLFSGLSVMLILVLILSTCIGAVKISPVQLWYMLNYSTGIETKTAFAPQQLSVLSTLRIPRVLLGALVGAGLAVSGAAVQGLFRNPLAEPGLIGISSGASLFAVLMIVFEARFIDVFSLVFGYYSLSVIAFAGAAVTALIVHRIAMRNGKTDIVSLLLAGIAINALTGAFTGLLTFTATNSELRSITFWNMGSLGGASWSALMTILPFIGSAVFILPFFATRLNALALGESQALHMGIRINRLKTQVIILATMAVGASVAICGIIGFISLVIPHIIRMLCGADHRLVIPASALLGAVVLTLADLLSRTIIAPAELPIGIITALLGSPVFIYMIVSERKKRFQHD